MENTTVFYCFLHVVPQKLFWGIGLVLLCALMSCGEKLLPGDLQPTDTEIIHGSDSQWNTDSEEDTDSFGGTDTGTDTSSSTELEDVDAWIHYNQVGYDALYTKRAVVESDAPLEAFKLVRQIDNVDVLVKGLEAVPKVDEWEGRAHFYRADFSEITAPGYYLIVAGSTVSEPFKIEENLLFESTFDLLLQYFYDSRATDEDVWAQDEHVPFFGSTDTEDVRGGWYDASGDISKYLSHLSYANYMNPQQTPLTVWGLAWVRDNVSSWVSSARDQKLLDEALYGADYLLRVLDDKGYFYINVFDNWTGDLRERRICAYEGIGENIMTDDWQAAYREGGGMSIAALASISKWGINSDDFTSQDYLDGAERGFAHLEANNSQYTDDGEDNIIDDYTALLAAVELYNVTHSASYLMNARNRAQSLVSRLHSDGYFIANAGDRPFWHASDAGLPVVALARYAAVETDTDHRSEAIEAMEIHLAYLTAVSNEVPNPFGYGRQHYNYGEDLRVGFFIPHNNETGYWWQGENARLASLAAASFVGGALVYSSDDSSSKIPTALTNFALDQLNWILGANPYDVCFLRGLGQHNAPDYCSYTTQHGPLDGGIANGITGAFGNGTGIEWVDSTTDCSEDWRHTEQWLPHATWFLLAVTAAAL